MSILVNFIHLDIHCHRHLFPYFYKVEFSQQTYKGYYTDIVFHFWPTSDISIYTNVPVPASQFFIEVLGGKPGSVNLALQGQGVLP